LHRLSKPNDRLKNPNGVIMKKIGTTPIPEKKSGICRTLSFLIENITPAVTSGALRQSGKIDRNGV
jgi:hypothetical protein